MVFGRRAVARYELVGVGASLRRSEIENGDTLFSPFVAAGWSVAEEHNVRPAQWLGLLKILGAWGSEFYYTGFFSLHCRLNGMSVGTGDIFSLALKPYSKTTPHSSPHGSETCDCIVQLNIVGSQLGRARPRLSLK